MSQTCYDSQKDVANQLPYSAHCTDGEGKPRLNARACSNVLLILIFQFNFFDKK